MQKHPFIISDCESDRQPRDAEDTQTDQVIIIKEGYKSKVRPVRSQTVPLKPAEEISDHFLSQQKTPACDSEKCS